MCKVVLRLTPHIGVSILQSPTLAQCTPRYIPRSVNKIFKPWLGNSSLLVIQPNVSSGTMSFSLSTISFYTAAIFISLCLCTLFAFSSVRSFQTGKPSQVPSSVTRYLSKNVALMFPKLPKQMPKQFLHKQLLFEKDPKVTSNFGLPFNQICRKDLSKIAQSGHTGLPLLGSNLGVAR